MKNKKQKIKIQKTKIQKIKKKQKFVRGGKNKN